MKTFLPKSFLPKGIYHLRLMNMETDYRKNVVNKKYVTTKLFAFLDLSLKTPPCQV